MRVGIGYDIHKFNARGPLSLGGITVPSRKGLAGHSDADVLLHALTDALLGAIAAGDIGDWFPPEDPRYRKAKSSLFIRHALSKVRRRGFAVENVDATLIADEPKLTPYKERMRKAISGMLGVGVGRVSLKAKTTEGIGSGNKGIAAQAVVLLSRRGRGDSVFDGKRKKT